MLSTILPYISNYFHSHFSFSLIVPTSKSGSTDIFMSWKCFYFWNHLYISFSYSISDIMYKRTIETKVNNIYAWKYDYLFCQAANMGLIYCS